MHIVIITFRAKKKEKEKQIPPTITRNVRIVKPLRSLCKICLIDIHWMAHQIKKISQQLCIATFVTSYFLFINEENVWYCKIGKYYVFARISSLTSENVLVTSLATVAPAFKFQIWLHFLYYFQNLFYLLSRLLCHFQNFFNSFRYYLH